MVNVKHSNTEWWDLCCMWVHWHDIVGPFFTQQKNWRRHSIEERGYIIVIDWMMNVWVQALKANQLLISSRSQIDVKKTKLKWLIPREALVVNF